MISTNNIPTSGGGLPKTLQPGEHVITLNKLILGTVPYNKDAYTISMDCEGPDMGADFEGFFFDKDDPSLGRHAGQVGQVKMSEYAFADGRTKSGIEIKRDTEMLRALSNVCNAFGCSSWLTEQDNKHSTIEDLFDQFNTDKPFINQKARACIGGKEYQNKAGFNNYELFLPKPGKGLVNLENNSVDEDKSRLVEFNPTLHLKQRKAAEPTSSFEPAPATSTSGEFSL